MQFRNDVFKFYIIVLYSELKLSSVEQIKGNITQMEKKNLRCNLILALSHTVNCGLSHMSHQTHVLRVKLLGLLQCEGGRDSF